MLPFYLRHYGKFCDKIVVYDNQSTDSSREIVRAFSNTELREFDTGGVIDERRYLDIKNEAYKEERGKADFVVMGDVDEFLYAPDIRLVLQKMLHRKETILTTQGVEMVFDGFPVDDGRQIWQIVRQGVVDKKFSKRVCFSPKVDIKYYSGAHICNPSGQVRMSNECVYVLHFKWMGQDHVRNRYYAYRERASQWNRDNNIAWGDLIDPDWIDRTFQEKMQARDFEIFGA